MQMVGMPIVPERYQDVIRLHPLEVLEPQALQFVAMPRKLAFRQVEELQVLPRHAQDRERRLGFLPAHCSEAGGDRVAPRKNRCRRFRPVGRIGHVNLLPGRQARNQPATGQDRTEQDPAATGSQATEPPVTGAEEPVATEPTTDPATIGRRGRLRQTR